METTNRNCMLFHLSVLSVLSVVTAISLTSPVANHLAPFAQVSVSSTCNSNRDGITCNTTCPTRTDFPKVSYTPLSNKEPLCKNVSTVDGLPRYVDTSHGTINFKSGDNCIVNSTVDVDTSQRFTLSVWFRISSTLIGHLLSVGEMLKISIGSNISLVANRNHIVAPLEVNKWINLVLRYNGNVALFINGERSNYSESLTLAQTQFQLVLGPAEALDTREQLDMADVRWYHDVLIDREIKHLVTGTFQSLKFVSSCRCPATHPTLYTSDNGRTQLDLKCTNQARDVVPRLNSDAHPYGYMIDEDNSTFWASNVVKRATVEVNLKNTIQMKRAVLHGLQTQKDLLKISLNGRDFAPKLSGATATVDFEEELSPAGNRTVYELLLSKKLDILFEHSNATVFTVSEIEIHVRCPCHGNDDNCVISNSTGDFYCNCNTPSNTSGLYCETCRDEFYKLSIDQPCERSCDCHPFGSSSKICEKVGGQCDCKSNVDPTTRACDLCKFNTINITSGHVDGCMACACNPDGIAKCMDDLTCQCKAHVETVSGNCSKCLPNYYGISDSIGCKPCGCDDVGTNEALKDTCDMTTGSCSCKPNVKGRTCNECKDEYFDLHKSQPYGCEECNCNFVGTLNNTCNKTSGQCQCRQQVTDNRSCQPANLQLIPDYGPIAGGTAISITGELLGDQSVNVVLFLVDRLEVENSRNDSVIVSRTKRHTTPEEVPVIITWSKDGDSTPPFEDLKFTYKDNPTVTPPDQTVKTFASGGCAIDIHGEQLDNVPQPQLLIYTDNENFSTPCSHVDSSMITCQTPYIDITGSDETEARYGVELDNIRNYTRFSTELLIVPDPNVTSGHQNEFRNMFDSIITIKGKGLNSACRDSDVTVVIDNATCTLISRTDTVITCDPKEGFPGESREATIMLHIGNFQSEAGKVKFISFWKTTEFYIIVGSVAGGVLLIIIIIVTVCICRRRRKLSMKDKRMSAIEMTSDPDRPHRSNAYVTMEPVTSASSPTVMTEAPVQKPVNHTTAFIKRLPANVAKVVKTSIIDKQQIELGRKCTQKGGLIRILNGQFSSTSSSPFAGTSLTIKTLIDTYDAEGALPSWLTGGLLECTRLRDSYNENVLPLLGISIDDKRVYILYPEMSNRSLKEYMNSVSRMIQRCLIIRQIPHEQNFNQEKRLELCKQVAEGMNFLDAEHIVHKDLASRNCWVESNGSVKIGDASFSWDLYPDEYLLQNERYQPVRWMAPESLRQTGFYSSKTDVWSYGVLMWEVFTNGNYLPYHDIEDDTQIRDYVCDKGCRLGKPSDCSDSIYSVLEICHTDNSKDRPNFFIIVNHLTEIMAGGNPTIFNENPHPVQDDEVDYMNYGQMRDKIR